jgi:hypothetical protein
MVSLVNSMIVVLRFDDAPSLQAGKHRMVLTTDREDAPKRIKTTVSVADDQRVAFDNEATFLYKCHNGSLALAAFHADKLPLATHLRGYITALHAYLCHAHDEKDIIDGTDPIWYSILANSSNSSTDQELASQLASACVLIDPYFVVTRLLGFVCANQQLRHLACGLVQLPTFPVALIDPHFLNNEGQYLTIEAAERLFADPRFDVTKQRIHYETMRYSTAASVLVRSRFCATWWMSQPQFDDAVCGDGDERPADLLASHLGIMRASLLVIDEEMRADYVSRGDSLEVSEDNLVGEVFLAQSARALREQDTSMESSVIELALSFVYGYEFA